MSGLRAVKRSARRAMARRWWRALTDTLTASGMVRAMNEEDDDNARRFAWRWRYDPRIDVVETSRSPAQWAEEYQP